MKLNYNLLKNIEQEYGESFYLLDSKQFKQNYLELINAFRKIYLNTYIAYSYKTNYIPTLCKIIDDLGGYAEVVSEMEYEIAKRLGVEPHKIIFNGPCKNQSAIKEILLAGGCVNVDNIEEMRYIETIAEENKNIKLNIGIRCNFEINDNVLSRFGVDVLSEDFSYILDIIKRCDNLELSEMHCHFASRKLETWAPRADRMIAITREIGKMPDKIDLGGGIFGKMADSLKEQFDSYIPEYIEYAQAIAPQFEKAFRSLDIKPKLVIEPGSALVGDCMKFVAKVKNIKNIRGKYIATVLGSIYNINPTLNKKNPPIDLYSNTDGKEYNDLDFGGFTCIESDYLYRHYDGKLSVGDYVVFGNVGSYSVVLKPPFILPNFAIVDCSSTDNTIKLIKRQETFDDIFHTFEF